MPPTPPTAAPRRGCLYLLLATVLPGSLLCALVYWALNSASSTYLQPDALFYQSQGQLVMASVLTRFQASSTGRRGSYNSRVTYGTDRVYAVALEPATGRQLWQVRLDAPNSYGNDGGGAQLLGQSARYLFFYRNQLYVINKQTGEVVARNADFPAIASHLSHAIATQYDDALPYRYNDTLQAVVAAGTDGLYYAIDGQTLQARPYAPPAPDPRSPAAAQPDRRPFSAEYNQQLTAVYDDGRQCLALLDDQDTVLLAHQPYGVAERSFSESQRRRLYAAASNNRGSGWAALSADVFLYGGFLTDPAQPYQQPADSLARLRAYQSLRKRYDSPNAPLQLPGGGLVVMHRATIESEAPIQLTGLSAAGRTRWHVDTGCGNFGLLHHDAAANRLYLLGSQPGRFQDRPQQVLCIDLQTGHTSQYQVKIGFSLW